MAVRKGQGQGSLCTPQLTHTHPVRTPTPTPTLTPTPTSPSQAREGNLALARTLLTQSGSGRVEGSVLQTAVAHGHRAMAELLLREPGKP